MFEHIAESSIDLAGDERYPLKELMIVGKKKLDGLWVDRDDSIDFISGVFAAQVVGHGMSMAGTVEPGHIQILWVQFYFEQHIRPKGITDSLVGQLMGRMPLIQTIQNKDPLQFLWRGGESCRTKN
jgi:hypothetical protein